LSSVWLRPGIALAGDVRSKDATPPHRLETVP
jgi:hypothetical protein